MAKKTIFKNKQGEVLNIGGAQVLVAGSSGTEVDLNAELVALRAIISGLMAASDAMQFKGVLDSDHPLPVADYQVGWTYKVGLAGTYAGEKCELGDIVICVADYVADSGSDGDWQVVQANIEGAVIGPESSVDGNLAAFDKTTGKVIKDSTVNMTEAADAVAKKHEHGNADVVNALGKDDSGKLTYDGALVSDGLVDCAVINAGEPIPVNLRDNGVVFEIQVTE